MIKIADVNYELDLIDIIKELQSQLATQGYNYFRQIRDLPEDLMVSCPFHKGGQERRASCGIRKSDGWCHCFTCNVSTSLVQLISYCWGRHDSGQFGLTWFRDTFAVDLLDKRHISINMERHPLKNTYQRYITEAELDSYRYWHPYMKQRKLTDEVIDLFDIGYDEKTDCITFPIKDKDGNCLFIARRSVKTKFFNYPNDVEKPLYGLYELRKAAPKDLNEIIICESMINCLTVWGYGRFAIALNGTGSASQLKELSKLPYRKIILALDPDSAGEKGTAKIFNALKNNKLVTKLIIPKGKDVNDLSKIEFDNLLEVFL